MPNGRLSKCVLAGRKAAELYHNTSGNAASVSLFANAISTNTNSEVTVVVGIASTTLAQKTTVIQASAGTFCSMSAPVYYSDCNYPGVNTYFGFVKPQTEEFNQDNLACTPGVAGNGILQVGSKPVYKDLYGCTITEMNSTAEQNASFYICQCSSTCMFGKSYGGNELQNPALWMREYPNFWSCCCSGHWFWNAKVVGFWENTCCECCWTHQSRCAGSSGTWYPIRGGNIGLGNSDNARQNAMQTMINWCCCCGYIGDASVNSGKVPINVYSGCSSSNGCKCQGGSHCSFQWCKSCACHCCSGGGFKMWNWYALDREFQCCCDENNLGSTGHTCWCRKLPSDLAGPAMCMTTVSEGAIRSPLWFNFMWCCNCACGCVLNGHIVQCFCFCSADCGCMCWQSWQDVQMSSCCNRNNLLCQATKCFCHPCVSGFMANPDTSVMNRMSPYGFAYGMTNCSMMTYWGHGGSTPRCHFYSLTFPDMCYMKSCMSDYGCECYWLQRYRLYIHQPEAADANSYEFPIKYLAWNCNVTNATGTAGCTYLMIRSQTATHCGIFTFDANDLRISHGPFCGCEGNAQRCCGTLLCIRCYYPDDTEPGGATGNGGKLTKVADFPTEMASTDYSNTTDCVMCVSCLFRSDMSTWTMSLFNYKCQRWDGFQSSDLVTWAKIGDPYSVKISNILTQSVSSDYACLVDDCNCFFGNIDCSGMIDYKLSVNQYERTGVVLSDGDRVFVNNDADTCLSFQIWGYEG